MIRDQDTAQAAFAEFKADFADLVTEALRAYLRDYGEHRYRHTARTEANIIHDLMREGARLRFSDHPRVKLIDKGIHFKVCIDGEWVIKLKKMGRGLRTSNYPTQAALDFVHQEGQLLLPGVAGEPTNLHLGYHKREIELLSSPVYLTCPDGGSIAWEWMLEAPVAAVETPAAPEEVQVARPRVTPKTQPAATEQTASAEEESERREKQDADG
jgi:hypothetical protein